MYLPFKNQNTNYLVAGKMLWLKVFKSGSRTSRVPYMLIRPHFKQFSILESTYLTSQLKTKKKEQPHTLSVQIWIHCPNESTCHINEFIHVNFFISYLTKKRVSPKTKADSKQPHQCSPFIVIELRNVCSRITGLRRRQHYFFCSPWVYFLLDNGMVRVEDSISSSRVLIKPQQNLDLRT